MLHDLIVSLDDEDGVSAATFSATHSLVVTLMGRRAAEVFNRYMDASDERYYFKDADTAEDCWREMCEAMKNPRARSHVIKRKPK